MMSPYASRAFVVETLGPDDAGSHRDWAIHPMSFSSCSCRSRPRATRSRALRLRDQRSTPSRAASSACAGVIASDSTPSSSGGASVPSSAGFFGCGNVGCFSRERFRQSSCDGSRLLARPHRHLRIRLQVGTHRRRRDVIQLPDLEDGAFDLLVVAFPVIFHSSRATQNANEDWSTSPRSISTRKSAAKLVGATFDHVQAGGSAEARASCCGSTRARSGCRGRSGAERAGPGRARCRTRLGDPLAEPAQVVRPLAEHGRMALDVKSLDRPLRRRGRLRSRTGVRISRPAGLGPDR